MKSLLITASLLLLISGTRTQGGESDCAQSGRRAGRVRPAGVRTGTGSGLDLVLDPVCGSGRSEFFKKGPFFKN